MGFVVRQTLVGSGQSGPRPSCRAALLPVSRGVGVRDPERTSGCAPGVAARVGVTLDAGLRDLRVLARGPGRRSRVSFVSLVVLKASPCRSQSGSCRGIRMRPFSILALPVVLTGFSRAGGGRGRHADKTGGGSGSQRSGNGRCCFRPRLRVTNMRFHAGGQPWTATSDRKPRRAEDDLLGHGSDASRMPNSRPNSTDGRGAHECPSVSRADWVRRPAVGKSYDRVSRQGAPRDPEPASRGGTAGPLMQAKTRCGPKGGPSPVPPSAQLGRTRRPQIRWRRNQPEKRAYGPSSPRRTPRPRPRSLPRSSRPSTGPARVVGASPKCARRRRENRQRERRSPRWRRPRSAPGGHARRPRHAHVRGRHHEDRGDRAHRPRGGR